jgi:hypothetical protein
MCSNFYNERLFRDRAVRYNHNTLYVSFDCFDFLLLITISHKIQNLKINCQQCVYYGIYDRFMKVTFL